MEVALCNNKEDNTWQIQYKTFKKDLNMDTKHFISIVMAIIGMYETSAVLATENIWADHVVYNWDGTTATYTVGTNDNMTHGPFHSSSLWSNPEAILGKPNTLDKDDTNYTSGHFREISMVWPAWYSGTNDYSLDGTSYSTGYSAGLTSNNGCGLRKKTISGVISTGQIVVEFDEPIMNNPNNPYGIDFIVHGNPFFATGIMVYENSNMDNYTLSAFGGGGEYGASGSGAVFAEPVTICVAQSLDGPWYTFTSAPGNVTFTGDNYFPTQPYKWDSETHQWTGEELDWTKPVNPWIVNYFGNQIVTNAIKLYAGSAGGTGLDLDWLTDDDGNPANLEWVKYIKFSDPDNNQGEICAVAKTAPVKLGDLMSITQEAIDSGVADLDFVNTTDESQLMVQVVVASLSEANKAVKVQTASLASLANYANSPVRYLTAYKVNSQFILDDESVANVEANLSLYVGSSYTGNGNDIIVLRWNGNGWDASSSTSYIAETKLVTISTTLDNTSAFVITSRSLLTAGDANCDGTVDVGDLGILAANYGTTRNVSWTQGDFTGDGIVDVGDLGILAANYGTRANGSNFASDYATVFNTTSGDTSSETPNKPTSETDNESMVCSSLGLAIISGLALMSITLVRLEE
jgi:hypothetical protein